LPRRHISYKSIYPIYKNDDSYASTCGMRIVNSMLSSASPVGRNLPVIRTWKGRACGAAAIRETDGGGQSGTTDPRVEMTAAGIQEEENSGQSFKETGR
jgi:hypothetical protein